MFSPGISGNPLGRPRRSISPVIRKQEFRRCFLKLIQIRDGRIKEELDDKGKIVYVYPSVGALIQACKLIMEYTAGKPEQRISLDVIGETEKPNALQIVLTHADSQADKPEITDGILLERPTNVRSEEDKTEDNKA